jgi:hypothetical protein
MRRVREQRGEDACESVSGKKQTGEDHGMEMIALRRILRPKQESGKNRRNVWNIASTGDQVKASFRPIVVTTPA